MHSPKIFLDNKARDEYISRGVKSLHFVCKLNKELYRVVTADIASDDVIITDEQIKHIKERHPEDFELFASFFAEMIRDPDYIIEANKPNTALVLKEIELDGRKLKLILRLKTSLDPADYKNSIITFQHIRDKEYRRVIRNLKILYQKAL